MYVPFFRTECVLTKFLLLSQIDVDGNLGRRRSNTRSLLADAEIDQYDDDDEVAYLLDPITYDTLDDPVCTRSVCRRCALVD
mgnify:FL=1